MRRFLYAVSFLSTLFVPALAFAEEAPEEYPAPSQARADHAVSVTFSPLHLILPEAKGMIEVKTSPKTSVSVLGGYGSIKLRDYPDRFSFWELGGQFRYYLVGTFEHGMDIGGQVEYIKVDVSHTDADVTVLSTGSGVAMGPFIGYKLATRAGFTLDLQGGVAYVAATGDARSSNGAQAHDRASAIAPLVNIHVGWSF